MRKTEETTETVVVLVEMAGHETALDHVLLVVGRLRVLWGRRHSEMDIRVDGATECLPTQLGEHCGPMAWQGHTATQSPHRPLGACVS